MPFKALMQYMHFKALLSDMPCKAYGRRTPAIATRFPEMPAAAASVEVLRETRTNARLNDAARQVQLCERQHEVSALTL
jgi:hypothetical protein